MNKVILCGRLTRDPDVRWSQGQDQKCIARYTLAVDRRIRNPQEGQQTADFISCVAFGRGAEFAEKYLRQGTKLIITGHIQTGSYTNRDGQKVYTTDVVVEDQEFAESKSAQGGSSGRSQGTGTVQREYGAAPADFTGSYNPAKADADGFMQIPDSVDDDGLPFA